MNILIKYQAHIQVILNLILLLTSILALFSLGSFIVSLFSRKFNSVAEKIKKNLELREKLEIQLSDYIRDNFPGTGDVGIRFIYWKNYPWNIDQDAYKFLLHINDRTSPPFYGWIDNTGVSFEEHIWFYGKSVYVDERGIYFISKVGENNKGFVEYRNARIIKKIPFDNIVNFDFRERVEYEPIFYTRYKYDNKRIWDDEIFIRNRDGEKYFKIKLKIKYKITSYSFLKYQFFKLYHYFSSLRC